MAGTPVPPAGRCAGHFFVNTISMSKASKQVRLHALKSGPLVEGVRNLEGEGHPAGEVPHDDAG